MHIVAFIFARGGSKGIVRKNLRPLAGRPLLAHAIEAARGSRFVNRIVVSTDDEEIAQTARRWGAEVPFLRPAELAGDDCPERFAWRHAVEQIQALGGADESPDVFVGVPTTAPLRLPADIDACIEKFLAGDADVVLAVSEAHRNPYFNMVTLADDGAAQFVIPGREGLAGRQHAPNVYDMTTVAYVARPEFVLRGRPLMEGRVKAVIVPKERALDIDTPLDLEIAEFLLARRASAERRSQALKTA